MAVLQCIENCVNNPLHTDMYEDYGKMDAGKGLNLRTPQRDKAGTPQLIKLRCNSNNSGNLINKILHFNIFLSRFQIPQLAN